MKNGLKTALALILFVSIMILAGCGGDSGLHRITGLDPVGVTKTFIDAAKANRLNEAGLYVSPSSKNDPKVVLKYVTGQSDIQAVQDDNIVAIRQVAMQDNYAAVVVTLQQQNSFNITIKPVGLEKIAGEWYIVDFNQIFQDAKYNVLAQLLKNI